MGIEASIPLQTRVFKPKSAVESYGEAMKLKNLAGQQRLQDMQMTQAETEMANTTKLSDLYANSNGDMDAVFEGQMKFDPKGAIEDKNKYAAQQLKQKLDELTFTGKKYDRVTQLLSGTFDQPSHDIAIQQALDEEIMTQDQAIQVAQYSDEQRDRFLGQTEQGRAELKRQFEQTKFEYKKEQDLLNPGGGTTPSSVTEFEYRKKLPGGLGGDADENFLAGKRAEPRLYNAGNEFVDPNDPANNIPIELKKSQELDYLESAGGAGARGKGDVETALIGEQAEAKAQSASMVETGKKTGEKNVEQHDTAEKALAAVKKVDVLINHLETSDAITGMGADIIKGFERMKVLLGANAKTASDTEILDVMMGSEVFPLIKTLGLGARGMDTPAEREFLRSVLTGQINLNKETLLYMAKMRKGIAQDQVDKWNNRVDDGELDNYFEASGRKKQKLGAKEETQVDPVETPQEAPTQEDIDAELRRRGVIQ